MTQYIDKNKVEAILRNLWKRDDGNTSEYWICYNKVLQEVQCKLDTLEWKEVDFETAFAASIDHFDEKNNYGQWSESDLRDFAKHFFELGLQMKGK